MPTPPAISIARSPDDIVLVQLSDLHIGPRLDRGIFPLWGNESHDPALLPALHNAIEDVCIRFGYDDPAELDVLVSGDIAREGLPGEFANARAFLYGLAPSGAVTPLGLDPARTIWTAGNHDLWNGVNPSRTAAPRRARAPGNPSLYGTPTGSGFEFEPHRFQRDLGTGAIRLRLHLVDSNAGLPHGFPAFKAAGELDASHGVLGADLLADRARRPAPPGVTLVEALVTHHALSTAGHGGLYAAGKLMKWSRQVLLHAAGALDAPAILTGHQHSFLETPYSRPPGATELYELRCTTACCGRLHGDRHGLAVHHLAADPAPTTARGLLWTVHWWGIPAGSRAAAMPYLGVRARCKV